jgi:hypothetical protein
MIALDPEAHVGDVEGRDLSSSVITDISALIAVKSLSGIGMLVVVGAVEFAKFIWVIREMRGHPIENDADFCRMGRFDYCGGI